MDLSTLKNLRTYWEELRAGRIAPYRAELDPRKFDDALETMFILEQLNPAQLRVRLAGMRLCEMMGMEVRGMPPEAFIDAPDRDRFSELLSDVLRLPCIGELDLTAVDNSGKRVLAKMVLLPLRSDFGEITRIMGCVIADEYGGQPPVRFSINEKRIIRIEADDRAEPMNAIPGFAEAPSPFEPAPAARPALRSIEGNPDLGDDDRPRSRARLKVVK